MKQIIGLVLLVTLISSCSTIVNQPYQDINLRSNESARLLIAGDTLTLTENQTLSVNVKRVRKPLKIVVLDEVKNSRIDITSYRPAHYWANVATLGVGFIVDEIGNRHRVYPKKIFLDLNNSRALYTPYFPMPERLIKDRNRLSITPAVLMGRFNPGLEVSYQRLVGSKLAIQLSMTSLFNRDNEYSRNASGFRAGLEIKKYNRNQEKTRFYSSVNLEYFEKNHLADFTVWDEDETVNRDDNFYNDIDSESRLTVDKTYVSLTPRVGIEHYLTKKLVVDGFFGMGVRYRQSQVSGLDPDLSIKSDFFSQLFESTLSNRPRNTLTLNFDLNVRIGWVF